VLPEAIFIMFHDELNAIRRMMNEISIEVDFII